MRKISKLDVLKQIEKNRKKKKADLTKHSHNMEKIVSSITTVKICYPEYKEAFDYVDKLFPSSNVKDVVVYKVDPKTLEKMGYGGSGGFYDKMSKVVVIASYQLINKNVRRNKFDLNIKASITKDEVIAHELCHYCFVEEGGSSPSTNLWEEFAYGWTIGYFRNKGYSDEQIIKNYYLPFLVTSVSDKAFNYILAINSISEKQYNLFSKYKKNEFFKKNIKKYNDKRLELANEYGRNIIKLYSKKLEEGTFCFKEKEEKINKFGLLDL